MTTEKGKGKESKPCEAPGCERSAFARGLCHAHYMQRHRRGKRAELTPIREEPQAPVPITTRVSQGCGDALEAYAKEDGVTLYEASRAVLERWAARRKG